MAAHQAPPSLGFSWQEHRSGVPLLSPSVKGQILNILGFVGQESRSRIVDRCSIRKKPNFYRYFFCKTVVCLSYKLDFLQVWSWGHLMSHHRVGLLNDQILGASSHILKLVWLALPCCSYNLGLAGKVYPLSLGNPTLSWTFSLQPSDRLSSLLLKVNIILTLLYSH